MQNRTWFGVAALSLTIGLVLSGAPACSSSSTAQQCTLDTECDTILGVSPGAAQCAQGVCQLRPSRPPEAPDAGPTTACTSTAQCATDLGKPAVCLRPGETPCVALTTDDCREVSDDWKSVSSDVQPLFVTYVNPLQLKDENGAVAESPYDVRAQRLARLADADWRGKLGGTFPVGSRGYRFVSLYCDSQAEPARVQAIGAHMNAIGSPVAVVGAYIDMNELLPTAIANKKFIYCTDCFPEDIAAVDTKGLVYGELSGYSGYALALNQVLARRLPGYASGVGLNNGAGHARVAVIAGDFVATTEYVEITKKVMLNGKPLGDPANAADFKGRLLKFDGTDDVPGFVAELAAFKPDAIAIIGLGGFFYQELLPLIESAWPNGTAHRPHYHLGIDEFAPPDFLTSAFTGTDTGPDGWKRFTIVSTALSPDAAALGASVVTRFKGLYPTASTPQSFEAYDGSYVAHSAFYAALTAKTANTNAITGDDLRVAMTRLSPAAGAKPFRFGPNNIASAVTALRAQENLDVAGASSDLDWDPATGTPRDKVEVMCGTFDGTEVNAVASSLVVDPVTSQTTGDFSTCTFDD